MQDSGYMTSAMARPTFKPEIMVPSYRLDIRPSSSFLPQTNNTPSDIYGLQKLGPSSAAAKETAESTIAPSLTEVDQTTGTDTTTISQPSGGIAFPRLPDFLGNISAGHTTKDTP